MSQSQVFLRFWPDGEHIVWQGAPKPAALINRVFQVRTLGFYFTLLIAAGVIYEVLNGARWADIVTTLGWQMGLAAVALGLLTGAGHLYARSTLYTLTNRRLVLRSGVALPMMVNLPLDHVKSAGLDCLGTGLVTFCSHPTTALDSTTSCSGRMFGC